MFAVRGFLLGSVAFAAMTGFAAAADVPVRGPIYTKAPQAWSWEGQYIGIHGGYFDGRDDVLSGLAVPFKMNGGYGGLQFGYLHHLSRNWVLGYEVDVSFGSLSSDRILGGMVSIDTFGTARTRLGYAHGPWLLYGTAGLAWAKADYSGANSGDRAHVGYAVGAGIEYAFAPNWSAKLEYLYFDLGTTNSTALTIATDTTASTVRLGLNYRFANWDRTPSTSAFPVKAPVIRTGWTGPYIGIHGAYGSGDYSVPAAGVALDPSGGLFGIQSGYNWQMSRNWVFGLEGDSSWGSVNRTLGASNVKIDEAGTVRARLGYAQGNTLLYATGGLAWVHLNAAAPLFARDNYYLGWAAGAGIEYALTQRWSAKLEYLYSNYGATDTVFGREDLDLHTIKVGLNYRAGILDFIAGRW